MTTDYATQIRDAISTFKLSSMPRVQTLAEIARMLAEQTCADCALMQRINYGALAAFTATRDPAKVFWFAQHAVMKLTLVEAENAQLRARIEDLSHELAAAPSQD